MLFLSGTPHPTAEGEAGCRILALAGETHWLSDPRVQTLAEVETTPYLPEQVDQTLVAVDQMMASVKKTPYLLDQADHRRRRCRL